MTNTQRCDGLASLYDYYRMLFWLTYKRPAPHTWPEVHTCIMLASKGRADNFDQHVTLIMRQVEAALFFICLVEEEDSELSY